MAYIGHRCACRHSDLSHAVDKAGKRRCNTNPCTRRCRRNETSELLPTFDRKAQPIERIVPPGSGLDTEGEYAFSARTCDCDDCRALYTELTGTDLEPVSA